MKTKMLVLSMLWLPSVAVAQTLPQGDIARMEELFRELPMEAKRLTGPLFWLHGAESKERLESMSRRRPRAATAASPPRAARTATGWARVGIATWRSAWRRPSSTTWKCGSSTRSGGPAR